MPQVSVIPEKIKPAPTTADNQMNAGFTNQPSTAPSTISDPAATRTCRSRETASLPRTTGRPASTQAMGGGGGGGFKGYLIHDMSLQSRLRMDFQFPPAFRGGLGIYHLQVIERIEDNTGNNQPGIFLIVRGNNVPGRVMGACGVQAVLVNLDVMFPVFPLVDVREAEFPVLVRLIDAVEEEFRCSSFDR